ncbi:MAG: DUF4160 domain-containing protein [Bacteroidales bacterium]|nr:DUF4160 domain-containing protein [Bacteroidales bacterium]
MLYRLWYNWLSSGLCLTDLLYKIKTVSKDGHITGSLPRRALRLVYEWLDLHKEELLENWTQLKSSGAIRKIEPLK